MSNKTKQPRWLMASALIFLLGLLPALVNAVGPPPTSGPRVVRFEEKFGYFYGDQNNGLGVFIGLDADAIRLLCTTGSNAGLDSADYMEVYLPNNPDRFLSKVHGMDHVTTLWPFTAFDCDLFTSMPPLATGTVDFVLTDNDTYPDLSGGNNHNAFGVSAHGLLTDVDGNILRFSGHSRCTWDGVDFASSGRCSEKINVH